MVDREGALWTALERGIARIETPSPASFFDETDSFHGGSPSRHQGRLYIAGRGACRTCATRRRTAACHGSRRCRAPESVLVVREMSDPSARRPRRCRWPAPTGCSRSTARSAYRSMRPATARIDRALLRSRVDPDAIWVGLFDGLASLRWVGGNGSTKAASPASTIRFARCTRTPTARSGQAPAHRRPPGEVRHAASLRSWRGPRVERALRAPRRACATAACWSARSAANCYFIRWGGGRDHLRRAVRREVRDASSAIRS